VADQADNLAMLPYQAFCYTSSVITGAIINENDLIGCREGRKRGERIGD